MLYVVFVKSCQTSIFSFSNCTIAIEQAVPGEQAGKVAFELSPTHKLMLYFTTDHSKIQKYTRTETELAFLDRGSARN